MDKIWKNSRLWLLATALLLCVTLSQSVLYAKASEQTDIDEPAMTDNLNSGFGIDAMSASPDIGTLRLKGKVNYDYAQQVFALMNTERTKNNRSKLKLDKDLTRMAVQRAAEIAIYFDHERPDGTGCFEIFYNSPYISFYSTAGENIAMGYNSPASVMNGWMNSPGHRNNILHSSFSATGVGSFTYNNRIYWVQLFADYSAEALTRKDKVNQVFSIDVQNSRLNLTSDTKTVSLRAGKSSKTIPILATQTSKTSSLTTKATLDSSTKFAYTSSNKNVATFKNGKVVAASPGKATLKVYLPGVTGKFVTIQVTVLERFTDSKKGDWFAKSVEYCAANKLVNGTSDSTFGPEGKLTRKDFVTLIGRLAGVNTKKYKGDTGFSDVKSGQYYSPYIVWAAKSGIVGGTGKDKFSPDAEITREDMATIIVRYMNYSKKSLKNAKNVPAKFKDDSVIAGYAKKSMNRMREMGLLKGDQKGNVNPKGKLSRAEGATVIARLHQGLK